MKANKFNIVIVEDDMFYGEILRKYVRQVVDSIIPTYSVSVLHVATAEECLAYLRPETNMFLLDYNLGTGDDNSSLTGLDLLKQIKRKCPGANTVIVTNYSDYATINKFTLGGADRFILKNDDTPIRINSVLKGLIEVGVDE